MKEIKLSQRSKFSNLYFALVDDSDFEYLNQFKWSVQKIRHYLYAINGSNYTTKKGIKRKLIYMHRVIMKTPSNLQVDHIDHNGLNNQKSNLRNCTRDQNHMNTKKKSFRSKYIGVYFKVNKNGTTTYWAWIWLKNGFERVGCLKTEIEAARIYDQLAKKHRGEFAYLNFPDDSASG